jgi:hypothetical protein
MVPDHFSPSRVNVSVLVIFVPSRVVYDIVQAPATSAGAAGATAAVDSSSATVQNARMSLI